MTRAYLAFTDTGLALARRLADALPGSVDRCGSGGVSLAGWTALQFAQSDALVFVGRPRLFGTLSRLGGR